ncbi:cellulose biosynthesis protein BcsS [Rhodomicrobium sp. Az07]|uniref:cellulose biosynthesis protein BcsS n=1 Tax=Rhodomicrobium sp. Az07 TaxID=2839034 RepID=UPI001BECC233|nr:cellulose biosynthesis protein BcsS [Rhodomicrobium sp. Az07]MBT3069702.1 cellulose biosynthesis protein BcsS [Rhodomicrobium sp. Az07]
MLRFVLRFAPILAAVAAASMPCLAAGASRGPRFESYVTVDYAGRSAAVAESTVWSPFSPVDRRGFRLKLDGLVGVSGETDAGVFSNDFYAQRLGSGGSLSAGYQANRGPVWVKAYVGAAYATRADRLSDDGHVAWDADKLEQSMQFGAIASIDVWWRLADRIWTSANASYSQVANTASLYGRAAYEIHRDEAICLSLGVEGSFSSYKENFSEGNRAGKNETYAKAGALLNMRYGANDISLSGGGASASENEDYRAYATVSFGRKF